MFFLKKMYHYVPSCPKCGSEKTGRYIYIMHTRNIEKIIASHLLKGEIVKPIAGVGEPSYENVFCEECGCEWRAVIDTLWLNEEQIKKEKSKRGITNQRYKDIANIKKNTKHKLKEERKKRKREAKEKRKERKSNKSRL